MNSEELNDVYGILCADMFDLANKEELSFWDKQKIKGLETAFKVFKDYAKIKGFELKEPEDYCK